MYNLRVKKNLLYLATKRLFDVLVSFIGLLVLIPAFLVIILLISIEGGSPLLLQERIGKDGKLIHIVKFRTMIIGADNVKKILGKIYENHERYKIGNPVDIKALRSNFNRIAKKRDYKFSKKFTDEELLRLYEALAQAEGGLFKLDNDPRITRFGKFFRKTGIDELPQLWNVFIGNMSFVGPRPCVKYEYEQMNDLQKRRFSVKPGITCLWQVTFPKCRSLQSQSEVDYEYITKRSFFFDLKILLKTVSVVFSRKVED
jgi:lipopolysaccharide/colanic/teichoic acid biosynthesis glycosyltransferase